MMPGKLLLALAAAAVALPGGCNKQPAGPRKTLERVQDAIIDNDRRAFLACFDSSGREERTLALAFEFMRSVIVFDERLRAAYGDQAAGGVRLAERKDFYSKGRQWLDSVRIRVEGDAAVCASGTWSKNIRMVRKDQEWLVKTDGFMDFSADQLEQGNMALRAWTVALKHTGTRIGKKGWTLEKIRAELAAAVEVAVMNEAMP